MFLTVCPVTVDVYGRMDNHFFPLFRPLSGSRGDFPRGIFPPAPLVPLIYLLHIFPTSYLLHFFLRPIFLSELCRLRQ